MSSGTQSITMKLFYIATLIASFAVTATAQRATPNYCKPCLFYEGDFDPKNHNANVLFSGKTGMGEGEVYAEFNVPKGKTWTITGAFANDLSTAKKLNPPATPWSISRNVGSGIPGKVVCSGVDNATLAPTGRQGFGYKEYTVQIKKFKKACQLKAGQYWLEIQPQDLHAQTFFYQTDVENVPPRNHFGPLGTLDDSFWTSKTFGAFFQPTWGTGGACGTIGCDQFSDGLTGTQK
jgi:hypothetical protein